MRKLKRKEKCSKEKMEPFSFTDIDMDIQRKLLDSVLRPKYIGQKSVQSRLRIIRDKLSVLVETEEKVDNIMNVIVDDIIPAGTKGNVRGLEFNHIIKSMLEMKMEPNQLELSFETNCPVYDTSEIPDWWIYCKVTNKYVIGYNQIDLWNGGSQINRANKYLSEDFHHKTPWNVSILCVVCYPLPLKKKNTNKYEMFSKAFLQHRLCYTSAMIHVVKKLLL